MADRERLRLDKWLWAARFYKTRALAKQAIDGGKVSCDGERCKPSKEIAIGCVIRLRQGFDEKTVVARALDDRRRGAPQAQQLYEETPESIALRQLRAAQRQAQPRPLRTEGRPTKKDRRQIRRFQNSKDQGPG